jgi:hypothetical protein
MFCFNTAMLNIKRHKQKGILVVFISLLVVFFVFIYAGSIITNQSQYDNLPRELPVTARIENHNGSQVVGLIISEQMIGKIKNSGFAKDLYYSTRMAANFSSMPDEKNALINIQIRCVNDIEAVPNYKDRNLKLKNTVDTGFLHGKDALCIADELFLQKNDLVVGDTIALNIYGYLYDSSTERFRFVPLGSCSLLIVGSISSSASVEDLSMMDILCPIEWAKEKILEAGESFYYDSARFTVSDPMNLNTFKAAMKKCFLLPVEPLSDYSVAGIALRVQDETFIKTATRLKSSLTLLYAFAPVVFAVIALTGYAVSYLLMQSRRADIVIMRTLGTSRAACIAIMFLEFAVLGLAGAVLGTCCSAIFMGFTDLRALPVALLFIASFMLGITGAAFKISRRTAMSGLVKVEV